MVRLEHNFNFEGWNSQARRGFTGKFDSSDVRRDNVNREIGRRQVALPDPLHVRVQACGHVRNAADLPTSIQKLIPTPRFPPPGYFCSPVFFLSSRPPGEILKSEVGTSYSYIYMYVCMYVYNIYIYIYISLPRFSPWRGLPQGLIIRQSPCPPSR